MSNFAASLLAVTEIDGLRRRATAVFVVWLWLHLPVLALVGWLNQTGIVLPLALAVLFAGAAHAFAWRDPGAPATRYVVSAAFIGMVSLLVRGAAGPWQIDIHMYYFAVFAVLTAYCDARVILLAAALTAVHHLGLNFLLPYAVFPDGGNLWRVILHAGIVIAECGVLVWLCLVLEKLFAVQADAMTRMQATMAEREALESGAKAEREKFAAAQAAREARFVAAIGEVAKAAAGGDLAQRVTLDGLEGAALQIGTELNRLLEQTALAVNEVVRATSAMAAGDVRARAADRFGGRFGDLVGDVNGLGDRLSDFAARLEKAAGAVSNAAHEIAGSSDDLADRTGQQAESIQRTASAMEEMLATVKQNAGNAQAANQLAAAARNTAEKGGSVVTDAVSAMGRIEEGAQKIADIVGLIDEIAFQTNLLALNASVEAARAGEAGKGFAVVAQEVRALAQRSANASKDIKALIQSSNTQVRSGVDLVSQTGGTLNEIVGAIKKVSEIVAEIAAASGEQAAGLDEVNTAVTRLDEATQQNGALVAQAADAARTLGDQVRQLGEIVGFFRRA